MRVEVVEECKHGRQPSYEEHVAKDHCPGGSRRGLNLDEMVEKAGMVIAESGIVGVLNLGEIRSTTRVALVAALEVEES